MIGTPSELALSSMPLEMKTWDEMTLADVFFKYNSLRYMGGQIYQNYGKEVGDIWQKLIVKRMVREKLLGKNMKKFAKYPEDFK
jgi:hypothetical protein